MHSTLTIARLLAVAALLHALILAVVFLGNAVLGSDYETVRTERVQMRIVEQPPPPPPEPPPPPPEPAPAVVSVEPPALTPPKPRPKRAPQEVPPMPDKTPPPPSPDNTVRRRVVGLSLESTVSGGSGPAFAVGSSLMGETAPKAVAPDKAVQEPQRPASNRISTRFEEGDAPVVQPRRLAPSTPVYPPLLREQGIEADVVVTVSIDSAGKVTNVEVVVPAREPEFNEAAVASARKERFAPATRGGIGIPYTQRYTIRFRLNDQ